MAEYNEGYGSQGQMRRGQTDEYGNRVEETGGMGTYGTGMGATGGTYGTQQGGGIGGMGAGEYGSHGTGMGMGGTQGTGMGNMGGGEYGTKGSGIGGMGAVTGTHGHRRSDSSSSSEDDGQGGRRKKGIKEKIMEKMPGGGHEEGAGDQYGQGYTQGAGGEKKGMMDKIKDKIPGMH